MSNFTFDFDLDDDLDDQFDFAVKSTAELTKSATKIEEGYEPFAEVPIAELVRSFDFNFSGSHCTHTGTISLKCSSHHCQRASHTHHS